MSLPFIEEDDALSMIKFLRVDTLPSLQMKIRGNTSDLEKCLLKSLDNFKVETVSNFFIIKYSRLHFALTIFCI